MEFKTMAKHPIHVEIFIRGRKAIFKIKNLLKFNVSRCIKGSFIHWRAENPNPYTIAVDNYNLFQLKYFQ